MNDFTIKQLEIILGYYLFENKKNEKNSLKIFSDKFNIYFNKDVNSLSISYAITIFKNLDPSFIATPKDPKDEKLKKVWYDYIVKDRKDLLKKIYNAFKKGIKEKNEDIVLLDDFEFENKLHSSIDTDITLEIVDEPKALYCDTIENNKLCRRDLKVSLNALKFANYECEFSKLHLSFTRKNGDKRYTEGHHLIPLEYQYLFPVNLDLEANIVSLCSECHNNLHYGKGYEVILEKIFNERKDRLKNCGISITLEQLINMYK